MSQKNSLLIVKQDVPPYTVVAGNPARKIRDVPRGREAEITRGALAALEHDEAAKQDKKEGNGSV